MKSNKEVVASVLAKSRSELVRRRVRRRKAAAAASMLGVLTFVTAVALTSRGVLTGNSDIPTGSAPAPLVSETDRPASDNTESDIDTEIFSTDFDKQQFIPGVSSEKTESSSVVKNESAASTHKASDTISKNTSPNTERSEHTNSNSNSSQTASPRIDGSDSSDPRSESPKNTISGSKVISSDNSNSRNTSSNNSSSKNTSSNNSGSRITSSDNSSSRSTRNIENTDTTVVNSDSDALMQTDTEASPSTDPEATDTETGLPSTDCAPPEPGDPTFYDARPKETPYTSARAIVNDTTRAVIATVTNITFQGLNNGNSALLDDIEFTDDPSYIPGYVFTVYTIHIEEELFSDFGSADWLDTNITFTVFGGKYGYYEDEQAWITDGAAIPIVSSRETMIMGGSYLFLLDSTRIDDWTLVNNTQSVYPMFDTPDTEGDADQPVYERLSVHDVLRECKNR